MPLESAGCPRCQDTGWANVTTSHGTGVVRCDCYRRDERAGRYAQVGVPTRFQNSTFDNFSAGSYRQNRPEYNALTSAMGKAKQFADEYPMSGRTGLLFHGGTARKRTHLAVATLKLCADRGFECLFFNYSALLDALMERADPNPSVAGRSRELARRLADVDVLLLDSMGEHRATEWALDLIGSIVTQRYNEAKGLIATTGLALAPDEQPPGTGTIEMRAYRPDTLGNRIGQDCLARLLEHCAPVPMQPSAEERSRRPPRSSAPSPPAAFGGARR